MQQHFGNSTCLAAQRQISEHVAVAAACIVAFAFITAPHVG